ncbi:MAG: BACON domain-containing carbohydrate-binding protein [Candidatus Solibacter sp.]
MSAPAKFYSTLALSLCLIPRLGGQQPAPDESLAARMAAINAEVTRAASTPATRSQLPDLLRRRTQLLDELIAADPAAALRSALSPALSAPEIETTATWEGTLEADIADDFEHNVSRTHWYLRAAERRYEVYFADDGERTSGRTVRLSGIATARRIAAASLAQIPTPAAAAQCTTTGPQNIAVLMLTTPSRTLPAAITASSLQQAFGSGPYTHATDSLNGYWLEMSYGQTWVTNQVFGPFPLGQDFSCDQSDQILAAAINAADSTVDFSQFTRVALMFPVASCPSYSGMDTLGCRNVASPSKGNLQASVGWFPHTPNTGVNVPLLAHEFGHAMGLEHARTLDYNTATLGPMGALNQPGTLVEYGDLFSLMGYPYNGYGISGQYAAPHKSLVLNWLQPGDYQNVQAPGTFFLSPYEAGGMRALRVLREATLFSWLWLEYRQPIGDTDRGLQGMPNANVFNGALIHYEDPTVGNQGSFLLDFNPSSTPNDFHNAALTAGHSWSDPYSPLTLTVNSATPAGLDVSVAYDAPCASVQYSSTRFGSAGGSGQITISAPGNCAWSASAPNWIAFTSATTGSGNGTVSFQVGATPSSQQRTGYIAVGRQSTPIIQDGSVGLTIWDMSPNHGSGATAQLTFRYIDTTGYANINGVDVVIDLPGSPCTIRAVPSLNYVTMNGGTPLYLSTPGSSRTDGFCTVYSTGTSMTGSGTQLTVTLQLGFASSIPGVHKITSRLFGYNSRGTQFLPLGFWEVPSGAASLSIYKTHPGNFNQGQVGATYTISVLNAFGAGPTSGTVSVTDTLPAGLTLASIGGPGWTCAGTTCTRSDSLAAGSGYMTIMVTVNVAGNAPSLVTNQASVSGGGSSSASVGDLTAITPPCTYSVSAPNITLSAIGGSGAISLTTEPYCQWVLSAAPSWLNWTSPTSGTGPATIGYSIAANTTTGARSATLTLAGQTIAITQIAPGLRFVPVTPCRVADTRLATGAHGGPSLATATPRNFTIANTCGVPANAQAYSLNLTVVPLGSLGFLSVWPAGQSQPVVSTLNSGDGRIKANAAIVPAGTNGAITLFASNPTNAIIDINGYFLPAAAGPNLAFYPIAPCRLADTRIGTGPLAGPALSAATARTFPVLSGPCGVPATAQAYAMNMTVVPVGALGFLSAWPAGTGQPGSSTLNAPTGAVTSNMAIVPAGLNGAVTVISTNATALIIDISGYFAPPALGSLDFYAATPCRVLDTRTAPGASPLGTAESRIIPVPASSCPIPPAARAYSLNATVVPPSGLGFLSLWGTGPQPPVSTLNAFDGSVVANAALVPAGTNGAVTAFASHPTHLILDINGYFQ